MQEHLHMEEKNGKPIHNPESIKLATEEQYKNEGSDTSISHFYDKLLKLKDLMNTDTAKEIAKQRHEYLEGFLEQFYSEWDGKR